MDGSADVFCLSRITREEAYQVASVANRLGISPRYLNSLFSRDLGIPVKLWMRELRFTDAVCLWRESRDLDKVTAVVGLSHRRQLHQELTHFSGMSWQDFLAMLDKRTFPSGDGECVTD